MSNPTTPLGDVVSTALKRAGISENAASIQSGIPRETLRRRLTTGDFKYSELRSIATVLDTTADTLTARAEGAA